MEKLEQDDGGDLAPIVRLTTMRGPAIAEKRRLVCIRAPRLALHTFELQCRKPAEDEGGQVEMGPRVAVEAFEKPRIVG